MRHHCIQRNTSFVYAPTVSTGGGWVWSVTRSSSTNGRQVVGWLTVSDCGPAARRYQRVRVLSSHRRGFVYTSTVCRR